MSAYTRNGLRKVRPAGPGSRVRILAPASPFERQVFEDGVAELRRLGFEPVWDDRVFEKTGYVAGTPQSRAQQLREALADTTIDAIIAVRGGYGSVQMLPLLSATDLPPGPPPAVIGYSDITTLQIWLTVRHATVSIHGPMLDRRLSAGTDAYDPFSFLASLRPEPMGPLCPSGVEVLRAGEARGMLVGGTLSQLVASLGTPWEFVPPTGAVLVLEDVGERPYRIDRMLEQARQAGWWSRVSGVVFGQMTRCDEPGGAVTARQVIGDALSELRGPVLFGFPTGHTTTPLVTVPWGVQARVVTGDTPGVIVEEATT